MDFSAALIACKAGAKIGRRRWEGQYVVHQKAYPQGIPINRNTADAIGEPEGTVHRFLPYLMYCTADGSFVPWVASQIDILAEDWEVLD